MRCFSRLLAFYRAIPTSKSTSFIINSYHFIFIILHLIKINISGLDAIATLLSVCPRSFVAFFSLNSFHYSYNVSISMLKPYLLSPSFCPSSMLYNSFELMKLIAYLIYWVYDKNKVMILSLYGCRFTPYRSLDVHLLTILSNCYD